MITRSTSISRLLAGESTVGTFVSTSAAAVEIVARRGFDPVCIDAEHAPLGPETVANMIRAADARGVASLVRVSGPGPEIGRALDSGALGVVIPHVETADQARECVDLVRYPPRGHRGVGPGRSASYGKDVAAVLAAAESSIALIVQVETRVGVQNAYEIADVDGVDVVFVGPADLAVSMGCAIDSEEHTAAIAEVLAEVERAGKRSGLFCRTSQDLPRWRELGATFFLLGGDISFLGQRAEDERARAADLLGE